MLCEAYLDFTPAQVVLNLNEVLSAEKEAKFQAALSALQENMPIQYIIGTVMFAGLTLDVDERVLIPRPETEELVYWLLATNDNEAPLHVLDIGTGSGCVAIALKKARPNWKVTAWDIDLDALAAARQNAKKTAHQSILKLLMFWVHNYPNPIGTLSCPIHPMYPNPKKHIPQHMY